VYEMQGADFRGLTFEQGLQVIHDKLKDRMSWVWGHDLEADLNETKAKLGLGPDMSSGIEKLRKSDTAVSVQTVAV
jgi:hypothetical protein